MDEQKKKMLMIGGVVALAVVVIIVAAVMMNHKKKVEQSPMIVHTTTGPIIVPASTKPALTYIRSTGGLYLICEFGKPLSTTKLLSEATPVTFVKCSNEYCVMFDNQIVEVTGPNISTDGTYMIYIHSLTEKTYLGLVGYGAYLDIATNPIGFTSSISTSDASIWNVVTM